MIRRAGAALVAVVGACGGGGEPGSPPIVDPAGTCTAVDEAGVTGYDYVARRGVEELRVSLRSSPEGHMRLTVERSDAGGSQVLEYESPVERLVVTDRREGRLPRRSERVGAEAIAAAETEWLAEVAAVTRRVCEDGP